MKEYFERLEKLEKVVDLLVDIIEFHHPEGVPLKYRRAFPEKGQSTLFQAGPFKKKLPSVYRVGDHLNHEVEEIELPEDPKEYELAKERLKERLKLSALVKQPSSEESQAASSKPECSQ